MTRYWLIASGIMFCSKIVLTGCTEDFYQKLLPENINTHGSQVRFTFRESTGIELPSEFAFRDALAFLLPAFRGKEQSGSFHLLS